MASHTKALWFLRWQLWHQQQPHQQAPVQEVADLDLDVSLDATLKFVLVKQWLPSMKMVQPSDNQIIQMQ